MNKAEEPTQNIEKETTMNRPPLQNQTHSHPDARPRSDRFRRGGRESKFLAVMKPSFLRLLATVLLALPAFSAPPEASDPLTKGLRATLKPDNAEFKTNIEAKLKCSVKNTSDAAVTLDTSVFQSAILCLGVFNADGKRLPTVPPPFPLGPDARKKFMKSLAPGEQYEVEISIYVFSPPLVPGTYSARVKNMESNTVKFKILEKMN